MEWVDDDVYRSTYVYATHDEDGVAMPNYGSVYQRATEISWRVYCVSFWAAIVSGAITALLLWQGVTSAGIVFAVITGIMWLIRGIAARAFEFNFNHALTTSFTHTAMPSRFTRRQREAAAALKKRMENRH